MSLIGSLNAGVAGMSAQADALSAISNNVANSQTVGFKETDTSFLDYITQASATSEAPGALVSRPQYTNSIQGTVTSVSNTTALAVSGSGFFAVQLPNGTTASGATTYSSQQYYTQAGDFTLNNSGNFQNSEGYVLDGYPATNVAGTSFDTNALQPIQVSQAPSPPVATANVALVANLPTTPPAGTTSYTSTTPVYDAAGNEQNLTLNWSQVTAAGPVSATNPVSDTNPIVPNEWALTVTSGSTTTGPMTVTFGSTAATAGTITSITDATDPAGTVPTAQATGDAATVNLGANFGLGAQPISLNLGQFGSSSGVTQYSGTSYTVTGAPQDGMPQGNYSGVTIESTGDVVVNYSNGATRTIAQIPLATFGAPDSLQAQSGQAFTATRDSGAATMNAPGTGAAGTLVAGAVESSNVDIATQFTKMIVAQQAYSANSKVITTANQMLTTAVNMIQG